MGPKRRRTGDIYDGEPGATQEHYIPPKRSDIWFDDGSVVLQAENTQFRVHRSMLSRHSEIFRDMFRMPQPSGEAMVEDCPLVVLMDSAEDIKQMLNALYDKAFNSRDALPYEMVAAMIRMGRKYEIPLLRNEGLARLTLEFPVALSEWEKLPDVFTHIVEGEGLLFDIVQLALENHILTVLPSAYYICSTLPLSSLLDGVDRGEGKPKARLPYEALRACILGRERLLSSLSDNTLAWVPGLGVSEEGCQDPHHCTKLGTSLLKNIWMSEPDSTRTMESWYDFLERCPTATTLCEICLEDAKMIHDAGRRRAWEQLPLAFGLPPWHKLENFAA